jgi:hypothetical protein
MCWLTERKGQPVESLSPAGNWAEQAGRGNRPTLTILWLERETNKFILSFRDLSDNKKFSMDYAFSSAKVIVEVIRQAFKIRLNICDS